jgi:hypothetical protein
MMLPASMTAHVQAHRPNARNALPALIQARRHHASRQEGSIHIHQGRMIPQVLHQIHTGARIRQDTDATPPIVNATAPRTVAPPQDMIPEGTRIRRQGDAAPDIMIRTL